MRAGHGHGVDPGSGALLGPNASGVVRASDCVVVDNFGHPGHGIFFGGDDVSLNTVAQSFTPQENYTLKGVEIWIYKLAQAPSCTLDIYVQDGPTLASTILTSGSVHVPNIDAWYGVQVPPISLTAGVTYYIRAGGCGAHANASWGSYILASDPYPGGQAFLDGVPSNTKDRFFRICASQHFTCCFGDGSLATACPCVPPNTVPNPSAAAGHGCANSQNPNGALLSTTGAVSPDTLAFDVFVSPTYSGLGMMLKGDAPAIGGFASADGIRCVDGNVVRFGAHFAGTNGASQGHWTYPNSLQVIPVSLQTSQVVAQSACYQLYYRDVAANFCNGATTNWSNGCKVIWP